MRFYFLYPRADGRGMWLKPIELWLGRQRNSIRFQAQLVYGDLVYKEERTYLGYGARTRFLSFYRGPLFWNFIHKNQELIELLMPPHRERRVELMIWKRGLGLAKDWVLFFWICYSTRILLQVCLALPSKAYTCWLWSQLPSSRIPFFDFWFICISRLTKQGLTLCSRE